MNPTRRATIRSLSPASRFPVANGVFIGGGRDASWCRKGGRLFYKNRNAIILADCPAPEDTLLPGKPRVWAARGGNRMYAVAPDESRAVVVESEAAKNDSQVFFVSRFLDELRRSVPQR